jgi:hypothetical protein
MRAPCAAAYIACDRVRISLLCMYTQVHECSLRFRYIRLMSRVHTRTRGRAMATYGYVRVSTVKQVDEGESLDVQQRTIAGYALMHGLTVDQTFIERGVSGSKLLADRPQGAALLAAIRPGDTIITPKLDRMLVLLCQNL